MPLRRQYSKGKSRCVSKPQSYTAHITSLRAGHTPLQEVITTAQIPGNSMQPVAQLGFHSSAIQEIDHDAVWLTLLTEFRWPGAHAVDSVQRRDVARSREHHQPSFQVLQLVRENLSRWTTWSGMERQVSHQHQAHSGSLSFADGHGLILLASAQLFNLIAPLASVLREVVFLVPLNMAITDRISIMSSAEMASGRLRRCPQVVCGRPSSSRPRIASGSPSRVVIEVSWVGSGSHARWPGFDLLFGRLRDPGLAVVLVAWDC